MAAFKLNIEKTTISNNYYRRILYTDKNIQLVIMSIPPNEEIGEEKHKGVTQFFRVEQGNGVIWVNDKKSIVKEGDVVIAPPGSRHNVINTGKEDLKLYTIYSPPEHSPNEKPQRYKK